jgi:hypothetical protein
MTAGVGEARLSERYLGRLRRVEARTAKVVGDLCEARLRWPIIERIEARARTALRLAAAAAPWVLVGHVHDDGRGTYRITGVYERTHRFGPLLECRLEHQHTDAGPAAEAMAELAIVAMYERWYKLRPTVATNPSTEAPHINTWPLIWLLVVVLYELRRTIAAVERALR